MRFPFVFFSRMRSEGFSFYFVGLGVETCSLDAAFVSATVVNRLQPSTSDRGEGNMAVPMVSSANVVTFGGFKRRVASFREQALRDIPTCFRTCPKSFRDRRHVFASFSEDDFHVSQQAQYFECVHLAFAWQRSTSDVCSCVFFCESHCEVCVKWWQRANRVASVGHRENVTFRGVDNIWCKSVARGMSNCVAGAVFSTLYTPHCTLTL